jgi:hypothetical protein
MCPEPAEESKFQGTSIDVAAESSVEKRVPGENSQHTLTGILYIIGMWVRKDLDAIPPIQAPTPV